MYGRTVRAGHEEQLSAMFLQCLVAASWNQLGILLLAHCHLTAVNMAQLQLAHWPMLHTLDLDGNPLCPASFASLSAAEWPHLESLYLCHTDAACMFRFGLAQMLRLKNLDLSCNEAVDSFAIAHSRELNDAATA